MNTLEWLPIFLPALYLAAIYVSDIGAALLGLVWIAGRGLYVRGYTEAAEKREAGFFVQAIAAGVLWLSALNVRYRDVAYVVPVALQLWMYASPVGYPTTLVPAHWRSLYLVNPIATSIEGFRWSVLGTGVLRPGPIAASASTAPCLGRASTRAGTVWGP